MKKTIITVFSVVLLLVLTACNSAPKLRILNWGEYINDDVVAQFEEEYGIDVIISIANSNELFYSKIKSKTTAYDIVIPSDYMVEKMADENMLIQLDYDLLPNYNTVTYMDGVTQIFASMTSTTLFRTGVTVDYKDYAIPYFWGTFGIIYNNRVEGLEEALNEHGWDVYFDATNYFPDARRGMYDVAQFAYAASLMYLGENPNEFSQTLLDASQAAIEGADFVEWGDDTLKRNVESDNLDMAFAYTGDYLDRLYIQLDDGRTLEEVQSDFNIYIPETTMVFLDSMVIPNTAKNIDAAHKFMNFLLNPANVALNAEVVGYAAPLEEAFSIIVSYADSTDSWRSNWALANQNYYQGRQGTFYPLTSLNIQYIDDITSMIQVVKTK